MNYNVREMIYAYLRAFNFNVTETEGITTVTTHDGDVWDFTIPSRVKPKAIKVVEAP